MFKSNAPINMTGLSRSQPVTQKNKKRNQTTTNIKYTAEELSLPPIMRPLLYEDFKADGR